MSVSGRVLARLAPAVLVLAVSLTACGGGDADPPADDTSHSSSHSDSGSDSSSDSATVEVTREGDTFTPNGERVELAVGQTLVLSIESDEAGELHVHSTPEQEIPYDAGSSEHEITIDRPGVVEVESHDPDIVLLQLEVR
jgi:hypothetical protein